MCTTSCLRSGSSSVFGIAEARPGAANPRTERLRGALKAARHLKAPYVFCNSDLKRWSRGEADTPLRRATRRAGLRKFGWHTLRHTFCSRLAMRGPSVRTIQELAGYASIRTTMRYCT